MDMLTRCDNCRSSSFSADVRRWFIGDRVGRGRLRCDERGAEKGWKAMGWMHERRLLRWVRETTTCGVETPGSLGYMAKRWRSCVYGLETFCNSWRFITLNNDYVPHCCRHRAQCGLQTPLSPRCVQALAIQALLGTLHNLSLGTCLARLHGVSQRIHSPRARLDEEPGPRNPYHEWSLPLSRPRGDQGSRTEKQLHEDPREASSGTRHVCTCRSRSCWRCRLTLKDSVMVRVRRTHSYFDGSHGGGTVRLVACRDARAHAY